MEMPLMTCEHIYKNIGADICPNCGRDTHETDWEFIKQERIKHREKYGILHVVREWWSI